jgi:aspartyl-tRNA(Asn)/glutamyl-tRNA(Gln) amidotransferase subunit C
MRISEETVSKIAELAKLEFNPEQKTKIRNDLDRIIGFVEKLNELDTSTAEPLIFMSDETNVLREDEVTQEVTKEEALRNAPKKDSDYFKAPKVLG